MAPLKKSVDNEKTAKKASNTAEGAKKTGLKKTTTSAASKKMPVKASKKKPAPVKKSGIETAKRTSRGVGKTPASDQEASEASEASEAGSRISKKTEEKEAAAAAAELGLVGGEEALWDMILDRNAVFYVLCIL